MKKILLNIALLSSVCLFSQKNLITNGGFENDKESWNNVDAFSLSPYDKKSGQNGGSITQFTNPQWKGIDQNFSIPKNTVAIEVSGWLKADGIQQGKDPWNKGVMMVELNGKTEPIAELDGSTPWKEFRKVLQVNKARSGKLMLALSACTGTLYFDDFKITVLSQEDLNNIQEAETKKYEVKVITDSSPVETISFQNGNFEKDADSWRGNATVATDVKKEGSKSFKLTSETPTWYGIDQLFDIDAGAKTVDISAFAKTVDLKKGAQDWNKGTLIAEFTSDGTKKTGEDQPLFFIDGNQDWTAFSKNLIIPEGSRKMRIMIALSDAVGTMYVDDIKVKFNK